MFFLLRMAFWLGLVLVLLPRDSAPETGKAPAIAASDAVSAAKAAVEDIGQFCSRQPAACEVGGHAATAIGNRAQGGAKKIYEIITDKKPPDHTGSIAMDESGEKRREQHDTLTAEDLQIEWSLAPTESASAEAR